MRIDILTPPFDGHLHPSLDMACVLAPSHDVRVVSTGSALRQICERGLRGVALLSAADDAAIHAIASPPHAVRSNPLRLDAQFTAALKIMGRLQDALTALYLDDRPDLMIVDFALPVVGVVADRLGIPWWTSMRSACVIETGDGAPAYCGGLDQPDRWRARLRNAVARRCVRSFKRILHRRHRRQLRSLGFPHVYRPDGSEAMYSARRILVLGVEELEFRRQWPTVTSFIGPPPSSPGSVPGPAIRFDPARQHVLVTAGTHVPWAKERLFAAVKRAAVRVPDIVFHFTDGDATHARTIIDGNVVRTSYIDYARSVSRYDLVVHHGGAGITYHCLAAAIPAIVLPLDYDQFDIAVRLQRGGLAARLDDLRMLADVVRRVIDSREMRSALTAMRSVIERVMAENRLLRLVDEASTG